MSELFDSDQLLGISKGANRVLFSNEMVHISSAASGNGGDKFVEQPFFPKSGTTSQVRVDLRADGQGFALHSYRVEVLSPMRNVVASRSGAICSGRERCYGRVKFSFNAGKQPGHYTLRIINTSSSGDVDSSELTVVRAHILGVPATVTENSSFLTHGFSGDKNFGAPHVTAQNDARLSDPQTETDTDMNTVPQAQIAVSPTANDDAATFSPKRNFTFIEELRASSVQEEENEEVSKYIQHDSASELTSPVEDGAQHVERDYRQEFEELLIANNPQSGNLEHDSETSEDLAEGIDMVGTEEMSMNLNEGGAPWGGVPHGGGDESSALGIQLDHHPLTNEEEALVAEDLVSLENDTIPIDYSQNQVNSEAKLQISNTAPKFEIEDYAGAVKPLHLDAQPVSSAEPQPATPSANEDQTEVDLVEFFEDDFAGRGPLNFKLTSHPKRGSVRLIGQVLTFDPGSDFQYLAIGDEEEVEVGIQITDKNGRTQQDVVTFAVDGDFEPVCDAEARVYAASWPAPGPQNTGPSLGSAKPTDMARDLLNRKTEIQGQIMGSSDPMPPKASSFFRNTGTGTPTPAVSTDPARPSKPQKEKSVLHLDEKDRIMRLQQRRPN